MSRKRIEIDIDQVRRLASRGLSEEQIADSLGISRRTLSYRKAESAQFAQAIKTGRAQAISFVSNKLMKLIDEGNITAIIFFLKTQAGWRETQKIEANITERKVPEGATALFAKIKAAYGNRD